MKFALALLTVVAVTASAAPSKKSAPATGKKNMDFDSQVVEGEIYRPDYSVVTGESPGEGWGVLRLRQSFADHAETDAAAAEDARQETKR